MTGVAGVAGVAGMARVMGVMGTIDTMVMMGTTDMANVAVAGGAGLRRADAVSRCASGTCPRACAAATA